MQRTTQRCRIRLAAILSLLVPVSSGLVGCTSTFHGYFSVLGAREVRGSIDYSKIDGGKIVQGEDSQQVFFIFPDDGTPSIREALDKALEQGNGDVMLDANIYYETKSFPILYDKLTYVVEGRVINSRDYIDLE